MRSRTDRIEALAAFDDVRHCDLLVIGSGAAGLSAALAAATGSRADVVVATKLRLGEGGSTAWAQGGIAAAVGDDDSPELHAEDTVEVGRGLCDPAVVRALVEAGPAAIRSLVERGARFDQSGDGNVDLGREGGHGRHRILHAGGDQTGAEISRALVEAVWAQPRIRVEEEWLAVDLLLWHGPLGRRVTGAAGLQNGRKVAYVARNVVLATGGLGQLYRYTTNPAAVTGDGIAMAARAGAELADLEFVQFHPTTMPPRQSQDGTAEHDAFSSVSLLTEALRGAGAQLVDEHGRRFMPELHDMAELAPRDLVARTLWQRGEQGEASRLDLRPVIASHGPLEEAFPTAAANCAEVGLDPELDPVPVTPAAHYFMGGIRTDEQGRSSLAGLWAAGEVTSSGVHGANRLASNSLLEAVAFGERIGRAARREARGSEVPMRHLEARSVPAGDLDWSADLVATLQADLRAAVRDVMWQQVGLVRSDSSLHGALSRMAELARQLSPDEAGEVRNLLLLGRLVAKAALLRTETRGGHYRSDFPETDARWRRRSLTTMTELLEERPSIDRGAQQMRLTSKTPAAESSSR